MSSLSFLPPPLLVSCLTPITHPPSLLQSLCSLICPRWAKVRVARVLLLLLGLVFAFTVDVAFGAPSIWNATSALVSLLRGVMALADCLFGYPDTKEKPFLCFCGAAFTRRDLLKRHTRISHQEGLPSPNPQPDSLTKDRRASLQTRGNSTVQYPYDARSEGRTDAPLQVPPTVEQWSGPRNGSYIENQGVFGTNGSDGALATDPGVTHDADILEAAHLLLPPVSYRDTCQPIGAICSNDSC